MSAGESGKKAKRNKAPRTVTKRQRNAGHYKGPIQLRKDQRCRKSCGRSYLEVIVRARGSKDVKNHPDIRGDVANEVSKLIGAGLRLPDIRKIGGMI